MSYRRLNTIDVVDKETAWAGGRDGLLLRYDGSRWTRVDAPLRGDVIAIEMTGRSDGWVATYEIDTQQSWLNRFDGQRWLRHPLPLDLKITALAFTPPHDLWVAVRGGRVLRFDGATWHEPPPPENHTLNALVRRPGTDELWAVGEFGTAVKWDSQTWSVESTTVSSHLNAIAWQGSDTLWVVGDAGVVLRLTAGEWTKLSSGVTAHLNGVSASAGDQVWICGSDALLNWDGQTFMPSDRPIHGELSAVETTVGDAGWAVGFGLMLEQGAGRSSVASQRGPRFYPRVLAPNLMGTFGMAVGDADNDGLDDIYAVSVRGANHLLMGSGRGDFTDLTGEAGVAGAISSAAQSRREFAALWADINDDGRLDLIVAGWDSTTKIFEQQSNGRFRPSATSLPVGDGLLSANSIATADVNLDGHLDLFVANEHGSDRLWLGDGHGGFTDQTTQWGMTSDAGSQQAAFADVDGDGDADLYLCRWGRPNGVYRNDGDRFVNISKESGISGVDDRSNGAVWADLDNDGDQDLVTTNAGSRNRVYRNDGDWRFSDASGFVAFASGPISYGVVAADFDLDGWLDLYVVNDDGATYFENQRDWQFSPRTVDGLRDTRDGRASTWIDLEGDGDPDLILGSKTDLTDRIDDFKDRRTLVYLNGLIDPVALSIKPEGIYSNRQGIGAKIWVWPAGKLGEPDHLFAYREISGGEGFLAQAPTRALIGAVLGSVYDIRVAFAGGETVDIRNVQAPANLTVTEDRGITAWTYLRIREVARWFGRPQVPRHLALLVAMLLVVTATTRYSGVRLLWSPSISAVYAAATMGIYVGLALLVEPDADWPMKIVPPGATLVWTGATALVARLTRRTVAERVAHKRRLDVLRSRADLADSLRGATGLNELLALTVTEVLEIYPFGAVAVYLVDSESLKITHAHCSDESDCQSVGDALPTAGQQAMAEQSLTIAESGLPEGTTRAYVPLPGEKTPLGVICADAVNAEVELIDALADHLQAFAAFAAVTLANAQLPQQITEQEETYRSRFVGLEGKDTNTPKAAAAHRKIVRLLPTVRRQNSSNSQPRIVGDSEAIGEVLDQIRRVAATNTTVLIQGDSGTGKELVARAIHTQSHRSGDPFVAVNCGAIPETLLESELFGHEQGAFTGADRRRVGVFEQADEGTIFLDEIGEMPGPAQVRLLRVLQERTITRLGAENPIEVDVRVIAATNRDLATEVSSGNFREDAFYRLNVFPVHLPALRERLEDIPALVAYLLDRLTRKRELQTSGITVEAVAGMLTHGWPGNIRELENCLERALVLSDGGLIEAEHLVFDLLGGSSGDGGSGTGFDGMTLPQLEQRHIENTLEACGGNVSEAARRLGVSRDNLRYRLRKYNIGRTDGGGSGSDSKA